MYSGTGGWNSHGPFHSALPNLFLPLLVPLFSPHIVAARWWKAEISASSTPHRSLHSKLNKEVPHSIEKRTMRCILWWTRRFRSAIAVSSGCWWKGFENNFPRNSQHLELVAVFSNRHKTGELVHVRKPTGQAMTEEIQQGFAMYVCGAHKECDHRSEYERGSPSLSLVHSMRLVLLRW